MSDEDESTIDVRGLDSLLKALKTSAEIRIGVLGTSAARDSKDGTNNAEVGAVHEFGTSTIPQRSFLRAPISEHLDKRLDSAGAFDEDVLKQTLKGKSMMPYLEKIKEVAVGIVLEAFDTGGFGKWPKWKNPQYKNNANQLLVDTTQLRNSITGDIVEKPGGGE